MKKFTKKTMIIFITVSIVLIGLGFIGGFYTKILMDEAQLIKEKEKQTSLAALMPESEINRLKEKIEKDETDYGDNYQEFNTYNPYVYKKEPDRIYFKSSKIGAFYVFDKEDENYEHLLEVVEDRMHYSVIDDYNLNLEEWRKAGGTSIKLVNHMNDRGNDDPLWNGNRIRYDFSPERICQELVNFIQEVYNK